MFENALNLGFIPPYCVEKGGRVLVEPRFDRIIHELVESPRLDVVAVVEMISRYYCFADRTLVDGIKRCPWMAKPKPDMSGWESGDVPSHGTQFSSCEEISNSLFELLQNELLEYCEGKDTVGILLSGGMDSRIVAGTLDYLKQTKQTSVDVVAITWGTAGSRDAVYARDIAHRLGWHWEFLGMSADDLLRNISVNAQRGCEHSPIHLHAMTKVRDLGGLDCILAASFGDSVGRAEYSGKHISQVKPFHQHTRNWFGFVRNDVLESASVRYGIRSDIERYHSGLRQKEVCRRNEIDRQAHYMRRMLNPIFSIIAEKIPVYQAFASPKVFGYMWSLSPEVRSNYIYGEMLRHFSSDLSEFPWSRTGCRYGSNRGRGDEYAKLHTPYGRWIREELHREIWDRLTSSAVTGLSVFNMDAVSSAFKANSRVVGQDMHTKLDEIFVWLASLAEFVEVYGVKAEGAEKTWRDAINGWLVAPLESRAVLHVNRLRGYR